jgi:replication-associated recombination protein RarA
MRYIGIRSWLYMRLGKLIYQLQQIPARSLSSIRRKWLGPAYRRYDREPFFQGQRCSLESMSVSPFFNLITLKLITRVFTLHKHDPSSLTQILQNALTSLPEPIPRLPPDLIPFLADVADGDARQALNSLELALNVCSTPTQTSLSNSGEVEKDDKGRDERLMDAVRKGLRKGYDRSGEERYDMISALHKCLRGSDGSAAMYWLARYVVL